MSIRKSVQATEKIRKYQQDRKVIIDNYVLDIIQDIESKVLTISRKSGLNTLTFNYANVKIKAGDTEDIINFGELKSEEHAMVMDGIIKYLTEEGYEYELPNRNYQSNFYRGYITIKWPLPGVMKEQSELSSVQSMNSVQSNSDLVNNLQQIVEHSILNTLDSVQFTMDSVMSAIDQSSSVGDRLQGQTVVNKVMDKVVDKDVEKVVVEKEEKVVEKEEKVVEKEEKVVEKEEKVDIEEKVEKSSIINTLSILMSSYNKNK